MPGGMRRRRLVAKVSALSELYVEMLVFVFIGRVTRKVIKRKVSLEIPGETFPSMEKLSADPDAVVETQE